MADRLFNYYALTVGIDITYTQTLLGHYTAECVLAEEVKANKVFPL